MNEEQSEKYRYVGVTFVINKVVGTKLRDEFFARDFNQIFSNVDYCNRPEERAYLGEAKKMIVISKSSPRDITYLFDNSDRYYTSITFLYQTGDLSNPPHVACSAIYRALMADKLLESVLKEAEYAHVGRFLYRGSESEQSVLERQDREVEIKCEELSGVSVTVGREVFKEFPMHSLWKKTVNISKILVSQQNEVSMECFYQKKKFVLKKEVRKLRAEHADLKTRDFYNRINLLERELIKIEHRESTTLIKQELREIRDVYESMINLMMQQSLVDIQKSTSRQQFYALIIALLTILAIVAVGWKQASVTENIGLRNASIMEDQTEIMNEMAKMQMEEFNLLTSGYLVRLSQEPFPLVVVDWEEQEFLSVFVRNIGNVDVIITDISLGFPQLNGNEYSINVSHFYLQFEPITVEGFSEKQVLVPVNPYANEDIREQISNEFLNRDLTVTVQIRYSEDRSLTLITRLYINANNVHLALT